MTQLLILQAAGPGGIPMNLIMMAALIAVMYFFFIRPQAQKQKAQVSFESEMNKGDTVVTSSGIIGTIVNMDEKKVTLSISNKGVIEVVRASISKEMTDAYMK